MEKEELETLELAKSIEAKYTTSMLEKINEFIEAGKILRAEFEELKINFSDAELNSKFTQLQNFNQNVAAFEIMKANQERMQSQMAALTIPNPMINPNG